ncbi:MAG TPA: rhomboid family intramembrane serine protease [Bryobacteraceae bacterium]|nr:rhomboid family intramembrane serine protease [Bryobacteraceae bacterium]
METRRMCPHCRAFITTKDRVCPYCNAEVGARAVDYRSPSPILGGLISHAHFTTTIILVINVGIYLATVLASMRAGNSSAFLNIDPETLLDFGGKFRGYILMGQQWRLVTAGFLHGGLLHIGMNMWVLWDVGAQVEEIYGTIRLLVIYFVGSVLGFVFSTLWSPYLSIGASAGLMGLIGAMIAVGVHHRGAMGQAIRGQYIRWTIYMLIIGILPGLHIDNAAHVGGLAGGFGVAYTAGLPRAQGSWVERVWRVIAYLCILVTAVSFLRMYQWVTRGA